MSAICIVRRPAPRHRSATAGRRCLSCRLAAKIAALSPVSQQRLPDAVPVLVASARGPCTTASRAGCFAAAAKAPQSASCRTQASAPPLPGLALTGKGPAYEFHGLFAKCEVLKILHLVNALGCDRPSHNASRAMSRPILPPNLKLLSVTVLAARRLSVRWTNGAVARAVAGSRSLPVGCAPNLPGGNRPAAHCGGHRQSF